MQTTTEASTAMLESALTSSPLGNRRLQVLLSGVLLIVAFWPVLSSMYGSWFDEHASMEHGILVIPAAIYMAWTKRSHLEQTASRPTLWGVILLLVGGLISIVSSAAHWTWFSRTAFLVSLTGWIATFFGFRVVRALAYPLCTLILMIAPPTAVYERLTLSLQLLSSRLGEVCLELFGYSVVREGNILELVGIKLSILEACSGVRSLVSILFMCVLYNYFFVTGPFVRGFILITAVPIAILGNTLRIFATGIASQHNRALVEGAAHEAFGYISMVLAAIGCILVHFAAIHFQKAWRSWHV